MSLRESLLRTLRLLTPSHANQQFFTSHNLNFHRLRGPAIPSLALASTVGVSFATYYTIRGSSIHADAPSSSKIPAENGAIHSLRNRKAVESFITGRADTERVEDILKQFEESHQPEPNLKSGIKRYDISHVASNEPMEDDHSEAIIPITDSCWSLFAVIDGHSGWETSAVLREELVKSVAIELSRVHSSAIPDATNGNEDPYEEAIIHAFKELDDKLVHGNIEKVFESSSRSAAVNLLAPAYAGACAILAFYDSQSSTLRVALTGDCRAVLGRRQPDGRYILQILTTDQTGYDLSEKARLEAAHPGENVVVNGRTMGYGPSRAFGDAMLKWSREVQIKLREKFLGRSPPKSLKTPPYLTAEPVVTKVEGIQDHDFVVLATDGLWECLTNEEVVGLVGKWIQEMENGFPSEAAVVDDCSLPVIKPSIPHVAKGRNAEPPLPDGIRYNQWYAQWLPVEKRFITVDSNAATHLIRNALGGADHDLREALLSMGSRKARNYRDDITATVIFFDKS